MGAVPVAAFYRNDADQALARSLEHLDLTHRGPRMASAAALVVEILLQVMAGVPLVQVLEDGMNAQRYPHFGLPFHRRRALPDEVVVGRRLSTACCVEDALPAVLYPAWKYAHSPEKGLMANTHLGGDNAHRGALLGAFFGADGGNAAFPERWVSGLYEPVPELL